VPEDGGSSTFPDDLDLQALCFKQIGDRPRAGFNVGLVEGRQRHAGYAGKRLEIPAQCGQDLGDPSL
jgi:hypothetical protein